MRREQFEALVAKAVSELPEEFRQKLRNVAIIVQDRPTLRQRRQARVKGSLDLLGLYEGVPHTGRTSSYGMVMPDKITIFRKPIEARWGQDAPKIRLEVRRVVLHEIGHHFGMDEETLERLEKKEGPS